jgi:hypothetical protein
MPIVVNWPRPKRTFAAMQRYLRGTPDELWVPIIDYWISELYELRSDVEARRVSEEVLENWKRRQRQKFAKGGRGRSRRKR